MGRRAVKVQKQHLRKFPIKSQTITERHYYEPTESTAFKREDGLTVGAVKSEVIKTGAPDWSDSKSISLISVGK